MNFPWMMGTKTNFHTFLSVSYHLSTNGVTALDFAEKVEVQREDIFFFETVDN